MENGYNWLLIWSRIAQSFWRGLFSSDFRYSRRFHSHYLLMLLNNQYSHDHPFCSLSKTTNTVGLMGRRAANRKDDVVSSKRDLNHCILWSLSRLTQLLSDGVIFGYRTVSNNSISASRLAVSAVDREHSLLSNHSFESRACFFFFFLV